MTINKDQVEASVKDIAGKIQEEAGKLVRSKVQAAKGVRHSSRTKFKKASVM